MKKFKRIINIFLLVILVLVLGVGGYCGYILLSYKYLYVLLYKNSMYTLWFNPQYSRLIRG